MDYFMPVCCYYCPAVPRHCVNQAGRSRSSLLCWEGLKLGVLATDSEIWFSAVNLPGSYVFPVDNGKTAAQWAVRTCTSLCLCWKPQPTVMSLAEAAHSGCVHCMAQLDCQRQGWGSSWAVGLQRVFCLVKHWGWPQLEAGSAVLSGECSNPADAIFKVHGKIRYALLCSVVQPPAWSGTKVLLLDQGIRFGFAELW